MPSDKEAKSKSNVSEGISEGAALIRFRIQTDMARFHPIRWRRQAKEFEKHSGSWSNAEGWILHKTKKAIGFRAMKRINGSLDGEPTSESAKAFLIMSGVVICIANAMYDHSTYISLDDSTSYEVGDIASLCFQTREAFMLKVEAIVNEAENGSPDEVLAKAKNLAESPYMALKR
jgi:hypothetical protein